jgi:hypothetical protein
MFCKHNHLNKSTMSTQKNDFYTDNNTTGGEWKINLWTKTQDEKPTVYPTEIKGVNLNFGNEMVMQPNIQIVTGFKEFKMKQIIIILVNFCNMIFERTIGRLITYNKKEVLMQFISYTTTMLDNVKNAREHWEIESKTGREPYRKIAKNRLRYFDGQIVALEILLYQFNISLKNE